MGCLHKPPAMQATKRLRVSPLNHTYGQFRTASVAATTDDKGRGNLQATGEPRQVVDTTPDSHSHRRRRRHMRTHTKQRERGAVLPMVGLMLAVLLGMAGLVIDLSGLFVAKTELQSAVDSCALSAAQELDGASDALTRATNAGVTAGNANRVVYQASSASLANADVTFSTALNGTYSAAGVASSSSSYVKCKHSKSGITARLIKFVGGANSYAVAALAVATRVHAQSTCPIPVALIPKTGGTAPNYGFQVGEWVSMLYSGGSTTPGEMGWYNLDGSTNANETKTEMDQGYCNSKIGDQLGTPGAKVSVDDNWNARFGIYKNKSNASQLQPDFTGYSYTSTNWTNTVPQNAYSGTPASGSDKSAANFKNKRLAYANYDDTGTSVSGGDKITGLNVKGGYKNLATSGSSGDLATYGVNRRVVLVPVISPASKIIDYACMLMLQPIDGVHNTPQFEFLGNAGSASSPCSPSGLAGGSKGPLVPALVQ
ncbi:pilus assembly protein TadG-related protein [Ralstonia pickettii]|uniref:pilus assembly protein TadG-related protein n=2 Tax=Pseudomonadota TaxID=1224 RepID=UPI001F3B25B8|nr:pilus assembly protein TadG-related protein [Ralstonia pickettii]